MAIQTMMQTGELLTVIRQNMTVSNRIDEIESRIDELYQMIAELKRATEPHTDAKSVEPKQKSDLEIFEQNIDDSIKNNYIDLDDIANGKELWEPYDANWWNK